MSDKLFGPGRSMIGVPLSTPIPVLRHGAAPAAIASPARDVERASKLIDAGVRHQPARMGRRWPLHLPAHSCLGWKNASWPHNQRHPSARHPHRPALTLGVLNASGSSATRARLSLPALHPKNRELHSLAVFEFDSHSCAGLHARKANTTPTVREARSRTEVGAQRGLKRELIPRPPSSASTV